MKILFIKIWPNLIKVFTVSVFLVTKVLAQSPDFNGQISIWGTVYNENDKSLLNGGIRFIPEMTWLKDISDESFFDLNISLNTLLFKTETEFIDDLELYRLKLRYATSQSELRIGLQKINFGPARILRSLRWFDTVDPTDPLKITNGVYGIRYKYNFLNNAEIWLWLLYGNDKLKGNEFLKSKKNIPEFGGRFSHPFLDGEIAGTYHHRNTEIFGTEISENRFALDGRWEIEAGLWFEAVASKFGESVMPYNWQNSLTLGTDYTFSIGNGLMITAEHMVHHISKDFLSSGRTNKTSALSISYPFGLVDNLSAFLFYQWERDKIYQTIQWNRVYDEFIINFNFYNYPESSPILSGDTRDQTRSGYGFQFMIIYNF